jgi:uncharacterized membrane protein (DUF485 family)
VEDDRRDAVNGTGDGRRTDVAAIEQSDAYRSLVAQRRRFTIIASAVFYAVFAAFVALASWGHDLMGRRISGGLAVGYLAALAVIVAVWLVAFAYSRASVRVFEPLAERAREGRD